MEPIFLNNWSPEEAGPSLTPIEAICADFEITPADLEGVEFLLADYRYEDYEGGAYVLFRRGGELFEVHGGHCSCWGLENQWEPEPVTLDDIRATGASAWRREEYADPLAKIIAALEA